jgi:hypothetical protein
VPAARKSRPKPKFLVENAPPLTTPRTPHVTRDQDAIRETALGTHARPVKNELVDAKKK